MNEQTEATASVEATNDQPPKSINDVLPPLASQLETPKAPPFQDIFLTSREAFWSVVVFGSVLGLLTALTTTTGIAATLIGLLFTFVGTTLLSWFRPDSLTVDNRRLFITCVRGVSTGILIGCFAGFACRLVEEAWIRPWMLARYDKPMEELRSEVKDLKANLDGKSKQLTPKEAAEIKAALRRVEQLLEKRASMDHGTSPGRDSIETSRPAGVATVFRILASESSKLALAQQFDDELNRDADRAANDPQKLEETEQALLREITDSLSRKNSSVIAFEPKTLASLVRVAARGSLSPRTVELLASLIVQSGS